MNRPSKKFMQNAIADFVVLYANKFKKGQAEHKGEFPTKPAMLHNLEQEIIDSWSYVRNTRDQVTAAVTLLHSGDDKGALIILEQLIREDA